MVLPVIVVQIIVAVVASILAVLLMPKPQIDGAQAQQGQIPTAEEGRIIYKIYGTVWVDDSQVLAWRQLAPEPIQQKGGKK
jgi:hypothetical protein